MKIVSHYEAAIQGRRKEMQDVIYYGEGEGGAQYCAVFDGHGTQGYEIASQVARTIQETSENIAPGYDALTCARIISSALSSLNTRILSNDSMKASGSTATVAIVKADALAVAYLGDSEAGFYSEKGKLDMLTNPHNIYNQAEVVRVEGLGYWTRNKYFGGSLAVSRAIGDGRDKFVLADAEIITMDLSEPGLLVVASDGVWGMEKVEAGMVEGLLTEEKNSELEEITEVLVETGARYTVDNASAVVARIE